MATMLIRNLPDRVDESRLRELLGPDDFVSVEFQDDPNPTTSKRQAIVTLDMPAFEADRFVAKYNGMIVEGRKLRVSVMHLME